MNFNYFITIAEAHKSNIEILKRKANQLGWKSDTINQTIGLDYSHLDINSLVSGTGARPRQVEVLQQLRTESRRELSALLSFSELHY